MALLLSITKAILSGFLFGNMFSILYSMAGGILSLVVMALLRRREGFSVIGISIAGGVFHNVGQLLMAMVAMETVRVMYYFPILLIAGVLTGFLIGVIAQEALKRLVFLQIK